MNYCNNCLQPDTRPGILFDVAGICPACNYHSSLAQVDWDERKQHLDEVVAFGRANNSSGYDCIIGVSGGKDSTRQAIFVKEALGMNPLLVCLAYPPQQISQRGVNNAANMINQGFDCVMINPAPITWQHLMRKGFFQFTNWCKSTELALFSSVPRLAIAYQIPLIWWGENAALQLGDLNIAGADGADGNNLRHMNTLSGGDASWLLDTEIKNSQILQYIYPTEKEMLESNLRIIFLSYFWKNWSMTDNGNFSALRGLDVRNERPWEIGDTVGISALDENWVTVNQMIKYLKFGFGRVTDYLNEDIRLGRVSRQSAIEICTKYDGKCSDSYIQTFSDYIGITAEQFWSQVDLAVNKKLFIRKGMGDYEPLFEIGVGL